MRACAQNFGGLTAADGSLTVLVFDASNAFNCLPRAGVFERVRAACPELAPVVQAWMGQPTTHIYWDHAGLGNAVTASCGVDQGCPLSPAFFAIAIAGALDSIADRLSHLSPSARVFAYLDDIAVAVPAGFAEEAATIVQEEMQKVGLTINAGKTQAWTRNPAVALPASLANCRVQSLRVLGANVAWLDDDESRVLLHNTESGLAQLVAARDFVARLQELGRAGLSKRTCFILLRTYAQGCVTHMLRANLEIGTWVDQLDKIFFDALVELLGAESLRTDQKLQATLRLVDGGLAFPSMPACAARAFLGSWALTFRDVAASLGVSSIESFAARCPQVFGSFQQSRNRFDNDRL